MITPKYLLPRATKKTSRDTIVDCLPSRFEGHPKYHFKLDETLTLDQTLQAAAIHLKQRGLDTGGIGVYAFPRMEMGHDNLADVTGFERFPVTFKIGILGDPQQEWKHPRANNLQIMFIDIATKRNAASPFEAVIGYASDLGILPLTPPPRAFQENPATASRSARAP